MTYPEDITQKINKIFNLTRDGDYKNLDNLVDLDFRIDIINFCIYYDKNYWYNQQENHYMNLIGILKLIDFCLLPEINFIIKNLTNTNYIDHLAYTNYIYLDTVIPKAFNIILDDIKNIFFTKEEKYQIAKHYIESNLENKYCALYNSNINNIAVKIINTYS
jgi:hypothetical protein